MEPQAKRFKILSWHTHETYLYNLSQGNFDIYLATHEKKTEGHLRRSFAFPFGSNVIDVPAEQVRDLSVDCILFQSPSQYQVEQFEILSDQQRQLPKIYLEHNPPQEVPTNTAHVVNDADVTVVHVTNFNRLMWDSGVSPTQVIDHGVITPSTQYTGKFGKGIAILNNLSHGERRAGLDVLQEVRKHIPLDVIGAATEKIGGLGEILHRQVAEFIKDYRFVFSPARYCSVDLAILEAMMVGLPLVGFATTETVTIIRDAKSGVLHTDLHYLIAGMKALLEDRQLASTLGAEAKKEATQRFNIQRFTEDWYNLFAQVISKKRVLTAA